jgi:hypothetical protein
MTTEEKQKFLYEEIIDAGLDAEEFQLFLENKNPDVGLDITRWSFDDLKKVSKRLFRLWDSSNAKMNNQPHIKNAYLKQLIKKTSKLLNKNTVNNKSSHLQLKRILEPYNRR